MRIIINDGSQEPPKGKGLKKFLIALSVVAGSLAAVYIGFAIFFTSHFFFGSTVNGIPSSGAKVEDVESALLKEAADYRLTIKEAAGKEETLRSADLGLTLSLKGNEVEKLLKSQNPFNWIQGSLSKKKYLSRSLVTVDDAKLKSTASSLKCVTDKNAVMPKDATYGFVNGSFAVVPEEEGTVVNKDILVTAMKDASISYSPVLDLKAAHAYLAPSVLSDDKKLNAFVEELNKHTAMKVTYDTGDVVGPEEVLKLLTINEDGSMYVDEAKVSAFVDSLAEKYDTVDKPKNLMTSYGQVVSVPNATYGWELDKEAEKAALLDELLNLKTEERPMMWKQTAASHGENDYGNSYVEINLDAQHVFLYIDGQKVLDSPVVTGNVSRGYGTPPGAYPIWYRQRNAVLRGPGYASPVSYWMPFNGGIGLHDANWRYSFGGGIFLTSGSHGCVNLPVDIAPQIYDKVSKGFPVLVYNLPGTGSYSETTYNYAKQRGDIYSQYGDAAEKVSERISNIGDVTPESGPAIAAARAAYDSLADEGKGLVGNYQVLVDSETVFNSLMQAPPPAPEPAPAPVPEPAPAPVPEPVPAPE